MSLLDFCPVLDVRSQELRGASSLLGASGSRDSSALKFHSGFVIGGVTE